jgi:Cu(I)/Ag(I) efflux system membrane fusion protein
VVIRPVIGEAGEGLEQLYSAYFDVQRALAADKAPPAAASQALSQAASRLSTMKQVPEASRKLLSEIAAKSEHLHHMDVAGARKAFKPISHAVVTLATQVRSDRASTIFTHFYCPMVPDGGGDWLQPDDSLVNPYFGSEMLRCGEKVEQFPLKPASPPINAMPKSNGPSSPQTQKDA